MQMWQLQHVDVMLTDACSAWCSVGTVARAMAEVADQPLELGTSADDNSEGIEGEQDLSCKHW
jgi:hypothetical protein